MDRDNKPRAVSPETDVPLQDASALVERLRRGEADAGHQFVRDYYPGIYRYLLALSERTELAEDLTQKTFLQAWRHLNQFQGRAPLHGWKPMQVGNGPHERISGAASPATAAGPPPPPSRSVSA